MERRLFKYVKPGLQVKKIGCKNKTQQKLGRRGDTQGIM